MVDLDERRRRTRAGPTAHPGPGAQWGVWRARALGTRAELVVADRRALAAATAIACEELERIDRAASRFRPDSELVALNNAGGRPQPVGPALFEAIAVALRVARATDGAVDPTVGAAMCRLGYDRDFADVAPGVAGTLPEPAPVPGWRRITLDTARRTVALGPEVQLDLGATAKALAADRAAQRIAEQLGCGVLVSLGGDVAVAGPAPDGGFPVGLGDACGDRATCAVALSSGGLATSGIGARSWLLGTVRVHHLLHPSTSLPVAPRWRTATVAAGSCVDANAASTAALVKGSDAPKWLEQLGLPARLVSPEGVETLVGDWPAALDEQAGQGMQPAAHEAHGTTTRTSSGVAAGIDAGAPWR